MVFIGKETRSGVWRNKPADFLDNEASARCQSLFGVTTLVTHRVSELLHQQNERKRKYGKPGLGRFELIYHTSAQKTDL